MNTGAKGGARLKDNVSFVILKSFLLVLEFLKDKFIRVYCKYNQYFTINNGV